ncbi:MAG: hypothetical protein JSU01_14745 [Bacteroidetes bacterium]|nr:hypothetical protein [Bacteroidota bacterium]
MKKIFLLLCMSCCFTAMAQTNSSGPFDYRPYFSAVIVSNIDTSAKWYEALLGLTVKNTINDPGNGYKVVTLESRVFLMELLQLDGSIAKKRF